MNTFDLDKHKAANDFALRWFEIHAAQRLTMFNFFIIISGFSIAGYFTALQAEKSVAASVIAACLVAVCFSFKFIDQRTAQLVCLGEDYLKKSLPFLEGEVGVPGLNIVQQAENKGPIWSYRRSFNLLFWIFGGLGMAGTLYPWMSSFSVCVIAA